MQQQAARPPAADTAAPGTAAVTHASSVYQRLRADILSGRLPPGRLPIRGLTERYGVGQTPLREALNRLAADGLLLAEDQRGFAVPGISAAELEELTRTRCWLEERALRESIAAATEAWEESLVLAAHRLSRTPRTLEGSVLNPAWEERHRAFHERLIGNCGSRWLIGFCRQLTDRHQRYRHLAAGRSLAARDVEAEHREILDATLRRDADAAVALLAAHYWRTARIILEDRSLFPADEAALGRTGRGG
ncbi:MAG: GntR family transcriptional regulator [Acetobacteraceae bacterium]|nr:GntR family transcriptional regulator [Acetobacteraceae bacterium]MDW8399453.1 GntR family transcriptional regulator [Acetobacteraceae bacterium]